MFGTDRGTGDDAGVKTVFSLTCGSFVYIFEKLRLISRLNRSMEINFLDYNAFLK